MPRFDDLQRAGFGGIEFPVTAVRVRGKYGHFVHRYLRVAGGAVEKLERELYMVEMDAVFDVNVKGYGTLWPDKLAALRKMYESGATEDLVVPTIGAIPAMMPEWDQVAELAQRRSGETTTLRFIEDQTEKFLKDAVSMSSLAGLGDAANKFNAAALNAPAAERDLFGKIQDAANKVLSIKDQIDLYGGLVTARIEELTGYLKEADGQLESLQNPQNSDLFEAFMALWNAAIDIGSNLANSERGGQFWVVPQTMTISDISVAIYGDTSRANDLLLNNAISDPFAVPAGETLIYFRG